MRRIFAGLLFVLTLSGCSVAAMLPPTSTEVPSPSATLIPAARTPEVTIAPNPTQELTRACFGNSLPTFSDYTTWTKLNSGPLPGHEVYVYIYVNDLAKDTYISASEKTFPTCATIVKAHLASQTSSEVTALTVMVKMPAGYDPQNNDWWWGMYDPTGKIAESSGKLAQCSSCHRAAAPADYVFSQKVMQESRP